MIGLGGNQCPVKPRPSFGIQVGTNSFEINLIFSALLCAGILAFEQQDQLRCEIGQAIAGLQAHPLLRTDSSRLPAVAPHAVLDVR